MKQAATGKLGSMVNGAFALTHPEQLSAEQWIGSCAQRLAELRPGADRAVLQGLALDMESTLHYFDPVMAAEMEHEGGLLDA